MTQPNKDKRPAQGTIPLEVVTEYLDPEGTGERVQAMAYAFSSSGRLLDQARLDEKGRARLTVPAASESSTTRVLVGPAVEKDRITAAELKRRGAVENRVRIDPRQESLSTRFILHPDIVHCWVLGLCFVRGRLVKMLGPVALPVCNATVEIYEVDWIRLIPTLPIDVIERIREQVIIQWPPPPPPPPERIPIDVPLGPIPRPPRPFRNRLSEAQGAASVGADLLAGASASEALASAGDIVLKARTLSTEQFRSEILKAPSLFKPYFCLIPLPGIVYMDLVATATTDDCGEFSAIFFRGCNNPDQPDLYFKAKQHFPWIGDLEVYAPTPVFCHTYWNYACGTEVTLVTSHPLARTCSPCSEEDIPELGVVVKRIGWTLLNQIYGTSNTLVANSTNLGRAHSDAYDRPFGGFLHLQMNISPQLRANNIMYYQARIRKGSSGSFQPLTSTINRYYTVWNFPPTEDAYVLGPKTVNGTPNLFEIPTELGPVPNSTWSPRDPFEEYHVKIPTNALAPGVAPSSLTDNAGKYELEISLFDGNGAPVNLAAAGVTFHVPTSNDPTPAAPLGLIVGDSFRMTLHIDNNVCEATINPPTLDFVPASVDCGVLEWANANSLVRVNYTPYHRNGEATYSFNITRGASTLALPALAPSSALPEGSTVPPGGATFTNTQTVARLLGGCPAAGFAAEVYVDSLATDGTGSELGYDDRALFAFALTPAV